MNLLYDSLFLTFLASILSLILVSFLLIYERKIKSLSFHLVSFGAGALLATGFTDTLPEAVDKTANAFLYTTIFIALFFLVERVFLHFHHHDHEESMNKTKKLVPFLMFGDAMHNFIDGLSIATTVIVSLPLGIVTTIAVFFHEIPHELGDFGILLHAGYKRDKVIKFNLLTALAAFVGTFLGFIFGSQSPELIGILLSLTTANFIYLSLADLLPEVHEQAEGKLLIHTLPFFLGAAIMLILAFFLKG
ncbi:MAG TPA: ZIP family metal transporter [Patescibacteria group bacterium]|nr:ZIP family metal transporter [Patescibacteria group bacterium]